MGRVWILADPCADPGFFARGVQARLPENSSDNVFLLFFVLNFYWIINVFFFKENYNFTRFRGWGRVSNIFKEGPTFSMGVKLFPGGRGSKC